MEWSNTLVNLGHGIHISTRFGKHAEQSSTRPTLVFLHEALGCIAMWKDIPEQLGLATQCDVLVYERRGYGESTFMPLPRDDDYLIEEGEVWLPRLLDQLGLDNVILIGHSDGGSIALIGAAALSNKVHSIITEAAHIYMDHLTRAGIEEAVVRYHSSDLPERLARYHGDRTDNLFRAWHETWLREGRKPMNFRPWLSGIHCPALIIQGNEDEYAVPEQVTDICAGIGARAEPLFIPKCGHVPHFEQRALFLDKATAFITQHLND